MNRKCTTLSQHGFQAISAATVLSFGLVVRAIPIVIGDWPYGLLGIEQPKAGRGMDGKTKVAFVYSPVRAQSAGGGQNPFNPRAVRGAAAFRFSPSLKCFRTFTMPYLFVYVNL